MQDAKKVAINQKIQINNSIKTGDPGVPNNFYNNNSPNNQNLQSNAFGNRG